MKHLLAALLCLLLCGCVPQTTPETEPPPETTPAKISMYDPGHPMEQAHPGLIRVYPLTMRKVHGVLPFGNHVVTLSGFGCTTLTLLTGEELWEEASLELDFELHQEDPSLRQHGEHLSFFDPTKQETVVLDSRLQEVRRIAAPASLSGSPLLSDDETTLYYCTSWAVMAWDLESGIRRTVRELATQQQELTGLHCDSTVLQCRISGDNEDTLLMLSAENGTQLRELPGEASVTTLDSRYFCVLPAGKMTLLIYGADDTEPRMLLPEIFQDSQYYLPEDHAIITVCDADESITLDYYELSTGLLRSSLTLDPLQTPKNIINCKGHGLYILTYDPAADQDILYRWDVLQQLPAAGDKTDHTHLYCSADAPDTAALAACRDYARTLGEHYGITILTGEDATILQPWDYRFTGEHLAPVLMRELQMLEETLSRYPEEILCKTAAHYSGLTISLVREIAGTPESGSLSTATGIQFFQDDGAHVVIAAGKYARQTLHHELYHGMESCILTESTALDQWDSLNPAGFTYGSDLQENDIYLQGQTRAFVDRYSMTYPKEDRARIFEYAMLSGNEALFRPEYMQRKLNALCTAIRDTYGLKQYSEILPWEQYLTTPLAPAE